MESACSIRVQGIVQGVGFRPFVYRLARSQSLTGWVLNGEQGVEIHVEGPQECLQTFVLQLKTEAPLAASVSEILVRPAAPAGFREFSIRQSRSTDRPTARISPDLPVCRSCLEELFTPGDVRFQYPYINCADCGPRYTVIRRLPYDRPNTTVSGWRMDGHCEAEYHDPANRRFHAEPVACPACGPRYSLKTEQGASHGDRESVVQAAAMLRSGRIVAIKGLGGYHLACDARNAAAVLALRERKYRKERPFAVMARDLDTARGVIQLGSDAEALLTSSARPIVLAPAAIELPGVAPENREIGVMLPYTPLHHLLFAAGAPEIMVMTSGNRSSEPIAYEDQDAIERLSGIADAFLVGERPIARRVDDSVARAGPFGPVLLRRSRGYAPSAVTKLASSHPILALGADLKNTVTLVVGGQAFVSQHIGDLEHYQSFRAFEETIRDLVSMYEISWDRLVVVHDGHPQYVSTAHAATLTGRQTIAVQHHRAHIASVLAEREAWEKRVLGLSFDGTGYGDDGTIWGGEIFVGSLAEGFQRIAHLRSAALPGGDAAAQFPVQAAAGFLDQLEQVRDLDASPFFFPKRYFDSVRLIRKRVRTFKTSSMGRLFDTAAALLGFTREASFEGQAAIWLEQLARAARPGHAYPFPLVGDELDFRPLLGPLIRDRERGCNPAEIARAFQLGVAHGLTQAVSQLAQTLHVDTIVLSGGVFQNLMLLEDLDALLASKPYEIWTNRAVPPNDGGISLGQAAVAAVAIERGTH